MAAATEKHDEYQYLDQIEKVLKLGTIKEDRTGTGTVSYFGTQARYSLANGKYHTFMDTKYFVVHVTRRLIWSLSSLTRYYAPSDHKAGLLERRSGRVVMVYSWKYRR